MTLSALASILALVAPAADPLALSWHDLDTRFDASMDAYDMPGGGYVVVHGDRVAHIHGHGFADLASERPVDVDRTLFYLASVTKPFTAVAVLQQVERDALDLDTDVNHYLEAFRVPDAWHRPVTLRHLLTHSAGFDDRLIGHAALSAADVRPLGAFLASDLPGRVTPPGRIISYSNHGYGLAGHLVERASGLSFRDYVEQRVLAPLGMTRSTTHMPPPRELASDLATGYRYDAASDSMVTHPYGYRNQPPAGTINATIADMARFLRALLGDGSVDGGRVLETETLQLMLRRQLSHHPRLPGFALGLYERDVRGHRVLEHTGGAFGAAALMVLVPERDLGLFAVANQSTLVPHRDLLDALLTELFPEPTVDPQPQAEIAGAAERTRRVTGTYRHTRYPRHSMLKLSMLGGQFRVEAREPGRIALLDDDEDASTWTEIEPLLFRRDDRDGLLAFGGDVTDGPITHLYRSHQGTVPSAYERLAWYDTVRWQLVFFATLGLIFASVPVRWPIAAGIRRAFRRRRSASTTHRPLGRTAVVSALLVVGISVAFVLVLAALLGSATAQIRLAYGMPPALRAALWLPLAIVPLAALMTACCVRAWRHRQSSAAGRIHYTLVTAGACGLIVLLAYWNLLGPG